MYNTINPGNNFEVLKGSDNSIVMQTGNETGNGSMALYEVMPGIEIVYNNFHMREIKSQFNTNADIFCVDYCREGCIEQMVKPGVYSYTKAGDLRIDSRTHHDTDFYFPLSHYHGITIKFEVGIADNTIQKIFEDSSVSIAKLKDKYCSRNDIYFIRKEPFIEHIFSELYNVPQNIKKHYLKIKILELLLYLSGLEIRGGMNKRPYFYKSQTEKVKAIHALITKDLQRHYTLDELSQRFEISLTGMKNCFKAVYEKPIYSYLRNYRMNKAASLLRTSEWSISQISGEVGYDSPSKFASAFKKEMNMLPMEYRNTIKHELFEIRR